MAKISTYSEDSSPSLSDYFITVDAETGVNKKVYFSDLQTLLLATSTPVGMLIPFSSNTIPDGFLLCYGQAVSREDYSDLFDVIATTYGVGDGSTTFNLPDLRGRVIAGQDDMGGSSADRLTDQSGGLDGDVLGDTGGAEEHTLTIAQMPAHDHDMKSTSASGSSTSNMKQGVSSNEDINSNSITDTGGGGAHNNVQPTIILNYIIKT